MLQKPLNLSLLTSSLLYTCKKHIQSFLFLNIKILELTIITFHEDNSPENSQEACSLFYQALRLVPHALENRA